MFCVHFIYHSQRSHCGSGVVGMENECVGRVFGTSYLSVITAQTKLRSNLISGLELPDK